MTDPRAALADALRYEFPHSIFDTRNTPGDVSRSMAAFLAERGVLLVTEERLRRAVSGLGLAVGEHAALAYAGTESQLAAAIFAALSAEVEGPDKGPVTEYNGPQGVGSWKAGTE